MKMKKMVGEGDENRNGRNYASLLSSPMVLLFDVYTLV